jgi:hypothetical protein
MPEPVDPERLPVPLDVSYEVALDPEPEPGPLVPVDLPGPEDGALLPVIPEHLRTRAGVQAAVAVWGGRQLHRAKYHGVRSPLYLAQSTGYAVVGVFKVAGKVTRWGWVLHAVPLEYGAARSGDGREFRSMHKDLQRTRKFRGRVILACAAAAALLVAAMVWYLPWPLLVPLAFAALVLLARAGRPADKPIVRPAVITPRFRVLNADVVLRAYYAAALGDPVKEGQQVTFGGKPMRRDGEGSGVDVDLPYGKGLSDAIKAKEAIASGLDVQVSQVFLHRDPTSNRRHYLWVADRDPLAVPVGRTPLLACKQTDIWKAAPLGLDERGQLVTVPLMWHSVLVSALPRAGKTFSARLLALFAALDPYVKLSVFDAKGSPDWRKFALVADRCAFGLTPTRDGKPPEVLLETLQEIRADVEGRYERLSGMPVDVCPEGKLTRKIARDPRFGMPVRMLVLEEFQEYYDLGPISKDIAKLFTYLVKVGPGAGVILVDSTQRPSGIGGGGELGQLFTGFRDNHAIRFGLRTSSWQVSELCLGAGAYSEGLDTSALLPQYKGVGILRGATDESPTVRTYLADGKDAEKILLAARGLRERAGTLTGMAAGVEVETPSRDVLADVLAVFGSDPGLHWQVLAARLAKQLPERWEDASGEAVSAECRAFGVPSVVVKMFGRSLRGCRREDVERVAGE